MMAIVETDRTIKNLNCNNTHGFVCTSCLVYIFYLNILLHSRAY